MTEGFEAISAFWRREHSEDIAAGWEDNKLYGIEKDYRLARVSRISLFMHGADKGSVIFGDGLENYRDKGINPQSFDILVANPPYSVAAFKPHLKLKDNSFMVLEKISNSGSEIETLFVERIAQLLKAGGVAAVVLPSSILAKENESFISARESLLENFNIRAIVCLGGKTFGATGTNTVILFLQKFHEPPKRVNLVLDSVQAILENRDLQGWEDQEILSAYLEKNRIEQTIWKKFFSLSENFDSWDDVPYFSSYVKAFRSSSEYVKKSKQSSFSALPEEEQVKWYNQRFYDFVYEKEAEKLKYFALVYQQMTLIVSAPDDNKEQEEFLGYTWSNRKGQEGIKIKQAGGLLYNEYDRDAEDTIAAMIRDSFLGQELRIGELSSYWYYNRLQDMLDFSGTNFNKAIKTIKTRHQNIREGMSEYKLNNSDNFSIRIGDRVLSNEVLEEGECPVFSANVYAPFGYIDKQNIEDFSLPSVLWGIDGDWMVRYLPANQPFYPTDHCGVLRIHTDKIDPEYLALALQVEGEYEKFSRSNRASTQRIAALILQIPSKEEQHRVLDEIHVIEEKLQNEEMEIQKFDEQVKSRFVEMFGGKKWDDEKLSSLYDLQLGRTPSRDNPKYWDKNGYKWISVADMAAYHRRTTHTSERISELGIRSSGIKVVPADTVIMSFKLTIGRTAITAEPIYTNEAIVAFLDRGNKYIVADYLRVYLSLYDWTSGQLNAVKGMTLNQESIGNAVIPIPPATLQNEFAAYVESVDKLRFREALINSATPS